MSRLRSPAVVAMVASLVGAVAGCSSSSQGPEPTFTYATGPIFTNPSPSPSSTVPSAGEQNIAAAEVTVRQFWAVQDSLRKNANLPITAELLKVTRDTAYDTWSQELMSIRARQYRQIGDSVLVSVDGAVAPGQSRPTVTVTVCYDVSRVRVVDKNGKSVVAKDRVNQAKAVYKVQQFKDGWFVTDDDTRSKPCGA